MEMTSLINFNFEQNYISTPKGHFHFFKLKPPNFTTLSENDKDYYYNGFENLMRTVTEHSFSMLAIDQTINLNKNREFIKTLDNRFEYIMDDLLSELNKVEDRIGNTQRVYYFVVKSKQAITVEKFKEALDASGNVCEIAEKSELISVMRCFLLREFCDCDIYLDVDEEETESDISPIVRHLLPTKMDFDINYVLQTNFYRKTLVVRNLPQNITSGNNDILKKIIQRPNTTVHIRISDMNGEQVKKLVDKQFNNKSSGFFATKQTKVLETANDVNTLTAFYNDCLQNAGSGGGVKYVNIYIELYGKTVAELEENIKAISSEFSASGITLEDFVLRQKDGFLGVSPIGSDTRGKLLANNIPSNTFGRMYPFSASYINDHTGMLLGKTIDNGIISIDNNVRSKSRTNTSIAIVGDPGQGKSWLIKKIICQKALRHATIFNFDSDRDEYCDEFKKLGGTNINCARGDFAINPMQVRGFRDKQIDDLEWDETAYEADIFQDTKALETPFYQHLSWLSDFFKVLIPSINPIQLAALKILMQDVYKKFGIDENTDISVLKPTDYPIFSDLYEFIDDILENPKKYSGLYKMIDDTVLKELLLLLYDVHKGSLSPLFNKHTNIINSKLINFNIKELLTGSSDNMQAVLFNYLTYIWNRIICGEKNVMLAIDELHLLVNRDNLMVVKYLNSFVRRARKYEATLLTGTQRLADCLDPAIVHITASILDTPTYKFIFYPGNVDMDLVQQKLQLTKGEVDSIRYSNQRHCLLKAGKDNYHMIVGSLPFEAELFGTGGGR
ncbi:type IV secretory pathway VirB4 component [Hydrogenoanaerobacterium saccharovorans]|uniref:Type IV secretory pathway, VirB4 component n=1 Tax=Hydrogenoanaerobacterium saccharovorans TaxID=474960 RepID=A0A1H8AYQ9_9FIRM|nr:DUF87 domain-containing protein [Hydrogenoanaerobacterium saccharovorans]RPF47709.1 type IV secretory pathway VirB4 component [Hydrogenoanaerobacterium saccharovorans]SEM75044.1 Type IV secretory pathway, VirB4 component [Hydrogenoanaerobacterium saccharovorans]